MKKLPLRLENIGPRSASYCNLVEFAASEEQRADQPASLQNLGPSAWPPPVSEGEVFQRLIEASEAQTIALKAFLQHKKDSKPADRTHLNILKAYYCNSSYNTTVVIAALIITCCFTGILQPPGGTQAGAGTGNAGEANLGSKAAFKVFFVTNGLAMATASFAIFLLMTGHPITEGGANYLLFLGRMLVGIAVHFILIAFFAASFILTGEVSVLVPVVLLCGVLFVFYYSLYTCEALGWRMSQRKPEFGQQASKQETAVVEPAAPEPLLSQSRSTRLLMLGTTSWATPRTFGRSFGRRASEGSDSSGVHLNVEPNRIC